MCTHPLAQYHSVSSHLETDVFSKSQVALEYIFRNRNPATAVLWVYASSTSRFVESYKRIASECQIPGRDDPTLDTMQLVRNWLETRYPFEWLMIVDNVDDRTMFFEQTDNRATNKALIAYIPQAATGSIIYTTRNRDVGIDLASGDEPIKVSPVSVDEGLSMLGDKITRGSTEDDQITLLEELDYLPLAISHATAFMAKRRQKVAAYLKLLQDELTKSRVLDHRTLHHGREDRSSESVISTWWITFRSMKNENPRAAELLMMMSLMDRQQVPLAILQDSDEDSFEFEEAIGVLEAFSLITTYPSFEVCDQAAIDLLYELRSDLTDPVPDFCDMHRLVQRSTREWLARPDNDELSIATKALVSVTNGFPSGFYVTWPLCQLLYPHANAVVQYNLNELNVPSEKDGQVSAWNLDNRSLLLLRLSTYLREQGQLKLSENRAELSLEIRRTIFAPGHKHILDSMNSFALTIGDLGRHKEASERLQEVLEGTEKLFGSDHWCTLEALGQLGCSLQRLGKYVEAEVHLRRELSTTRRRLDQDPEDPPLIDDLIGALVHVANVLEDQGEFVEAQTLLEEALERSQTMQGQAHPNTWLIMESLAIISGQLGKYAEAHTLFAQVLAGLKEVYGDTHHLTLIVRSRYTSLLFMQGRYSEAELERKSLLEDEILVFGVEAYRVITSMHNVGVVLLRQKKYEEAETTFKRLFNLQEEGAKLGTERPTKRRNGAVRTDAPNSRDLIRVCLEAQGKAEEAQAYRTSPPSSPTTEDDVKGAKDLHQRSRDLFDEGLFEEAEATARQELGIRMAHAGLDNDHTQTCRLSIARSLHMQMKYTESQVLSRQVLAYRKRVLGWGNIETHEAVYLLAVTLKDQGAYEEAEEYYRQLLLWTGNRFGKLSVETYNARRALAYVLDQQCMYPEAEELFRQNLNIQLEYTIESQSQDTADAYANLGCVLGDQGKYEEGEACFQNAYDRRVEIYGSSNACSIKMLIYLAEIVAEQGKCHHADSLYLLLGQTLELPQSEDEEQDLAAVIEEG